MYVYVVYVCSVCECVCVCVCVCVLCMKRFLGYKFSTVEFFLVHVPNATTN